MRNPVLAALVGATFVLGAPAAGAVEVKPKLWAHLDYYRSDAGSINSDGNPANDVAEQEFTVRRARLIFDGKVNELLSGSLGLQADDSGSTGARTTTLKDAFADLKFHQWALVRVGLFKYEFDLEGRESATVMPFINRSIVTREVAGGLGGASGDFRDKGVALIGKSEMFGYGLGVWQGEGADKRDTNDKPGFTANAWGKLAGVKLNLGYLTSDNATAEATVPNKYKAGVIGATYGQGPVLLRAEYYSGERQKTTTQDLRGFYVLGVYTLMPNLDVMVRYQRFEDDKWGATNNKITSADFGIKYYIVRKGRGGSSVALNYMRRDAGSGITQRIFDERGGNIAGPNVDDVVLVRLQVEF